MIEPASGPHAEALATLHADAFPPSEAMSADAFARQLALPGVFAFIDPRGGFILARVAADEAEILTLAVAQAVRRHGIARDLLRTAMGRAAAAGAVAMFLEVGTDNEAARTLYAAAGFAEVGRRRHYYATGRDALILRAEL